MKPLKTLAFVFVIQSCLLTTSLRAQEAADREPGVVATESNVVGSGGPMAWLGNPWNHRRSCGCTTCDMQKSWEAGYYFGSVEYLMSWSKPRSVPALVTTSDPGTPNPPAGILGFSSTQTRLPVCIISPETDSVHVGAALIRGTG